MLGITSEYWLKSAFANAPLIKEHDPTLALL